MKALLLLLFPLAASAQSWDYNAILTGTETFSTNGTQGPVITSTPYTENIYVVVTPVPMGEGYYGSVSLDGTTIPQPINWPTTGNPSLNYVAQIGDAGSSQLVINQQGYATYDMGVCGSSCTSLTLTGTGEWIDPPAVAPEIDPKGATAGLTLALGLLLMSRRRA